MRWKKARGLKRFGLFLWAAAAAALILISPAYGTKKDVEDAKRKASSLEEEKKKVEATLKGLES